MYFFVGGSIGKFKKIILRIIETKIGQVRFDKIRFRQVGITRTLIFTVTINAKLSQKFNIKFNKN